MPDTMFQQIVALLLIGGFWLFVNLKSGESWLSLLSILMVLASAGGASYLVLQWVF